MGALREWLDFLIKSAVSRVLFLSLIGKCAGKSSNMEAGLMRTNQQVWTAMFAEQLYLFCAHILICSLSLTCPLTRALDFAFRSSHRSLSPRAFSSFIPCSPKKAMLSFCPASPHLEQGGSRAELCCLGGIRHNQPLHRALPRGSPSQTVTALYSCPWNDFVTHTTIIPAVTLTSWPIAPESLEKNAKANPVQKEFISVFYVHEGL